MGYLPAGFPDVAGGIDDGEVRGPGSLGITGGREAQGALADERGPVAQIPAIDQLARGHGDDVRIPDVAGAVGVR